MLLYDSYLHIGALCRLAIALDPFWQGDAGSGFYRGITFIYQLLNVLLSTN